jgi:sporulation protein YlmC with PRC-barrel domain
MKPFSKFEAISGKPVVTRAGKKVTQLKEFELDGPFQIVGVIEGMKDTSTWTDDGKYYSNGTVNFLDLFMETAAHEGWVAFGPEDAQTSFQLVAFATHVWPTEAAAVESYKEANYGHVPKGTVRIYWEE